MGFFLRRAVMGTLLRAREPMTVTELAATIRDQLPPWHAHDERLHVRVAEILRYQTKIGRAERVARGIYRALPDTFAATTRWRYEHWDQIDGDGRLRR